jgi:hypothetical protein
MRRGRTEQGEKDEIVNEGEKGGIGRLEEEGEEKWEMEYEEGKEEERNNGKRERERWNVNGRRRRKGRIEEGNKR